MKRMILWVLAATLVCGASVFTSCSNNDDNPGKEEAKKNRTEFIQHTRQTLKEMAENLNFSSWEAANTMNNYFNMYVLNNPEFNQSVITAFLQKVVLSMKPVEEGSELAQMGYMVYGTVDFADFNYRFTMNSDNNGWDIEPADNFEVIFNSWNPLTQQMETGLYKLTLKPGGNTSFKFVRPTQQEGIAIVINMPAQLQFTISDKLNGTWRDGFSGTFQNQITVAEGHEFAQLRRDNWQVSGTVISDIPEKEGNKADKTTLSFSILSDKVNKKGDVALSWEQNGRKMVDLSLKESNDGTGGIQNFSLSQLSSSASIFDMIATLLTSRSLDEAKITLLDDLTTTTSISDMKKIVQLSQELARARRNYADLNTIDSYTQQMNEIVSATLTCKHHSMTIPMRMVTTKIGVDYWTVPALNFADENGYVPLTDMLDKESIEYMINIMDHSVEPMQQSMITIRQLLQYVQTLVGTLKSIETPLQK